MNLTEHFTVEEFTASDTVVRHGIDNSLPATMLIAAQGTCEMLERIRAYLSQRAGREIPILITSGYRCQRLNLLVGGQATSDHMSAEAADFKAPAFGTPFEVATVLAGAVDELGIGQVIHEFGAWVHVSTRTPARAVNRVITISRAGARVGIEAVA